MTIYETIVKNNQLGKGAMMVTVIDKVGNGPVEVGKKMLVCDDGSLYGTVGGGALEHEAIEHAKDLLKECRCDTQVYVLNNGKLVGQGRPLPMACGGRVTLYFDFIGAMAKVILYGAGHVSQALCTTLKTLNIHVTVVDERPEIIEAFIGADAKEVSSYKAFILEHPIGADDYGVVCTPSHQSDFEVMHTLLQQPVQPKYLGMLSSKNKLKDFLEITKEIFGNHLELDHVFIPIGLDLGGGSPAEIAISIAGEILAIHYKKTGNRHMRGDY